MTQMGKQRAVEFTQALLFVLGGSGLHFAEQIRVAADRALAEYDHAAR